MFTCFAFFQKAETEVCGVQKINVEECKNIENEIEANKLSEIDLTDIDWWVWFVVIEIYDKIDQEPIEMYVVELKNGIAIWHEILTGPRGGKHILIDDQKWYLSSMTKKQKYIKTDGKLSKIKNVLKS